jgi:hypothetical protein
MLNVTFPITCPLCKKESLTSLPASVINRAILTEERLALRSGCHGVEWRASNQEAEQIQEYLWATQIA